MLGAENDDAVDVIKLDEVDAVREQDKKNGQCAQSVKNADVLVVLVVHELCDHMLMPQHYRGYDRLCKRYGAKVLTTTQIASDDGFLIARRHWSNPKSSCERCESMPLILI